MKGINVVFERIARNGQKRPSSHYKVEKQTLDYDVERNCKHNILSYFRLVKWAVDFNIEQSFSYFPVLVLTKSTTVSLIFQIG